VSYAGRGAYLLLHVNTALTSTTGINDCESAPAGRDPSTRRHRQEDREIQASLDHIARPCLKKTPCSG
jgi:hypothetical protein